MHGPSLVQNGVLGGHGSAPPSGARGGETTGTLYAAAVDVTFELVMSARPIVRLADLADVDVYADHVVRHSAESGRDGSLHFALNRTPDRASVRDNARQRWDRALDEPLWGRCFLLMDPSKGRAVGHLELRGGRFLAEMHRAVLGMGIERPYTGRGHGQRLMEMALAWAQNKARLAWIDLGVFEHNIPARKLYLRMGFVENGTREDAYHIDAGVSVKDVSMTLRLG
jgi:RimJ/RimL family protein N-acetyltransferase